MEIRQGGIEIRDSIRMIPLLLRDELLPCRVERERRGGIGIIVLSHSHLLDNGVRVLIPRRRMRMEMGMDSRGNSKGLMGIGTRCRVVVVRVGIMPMLPSEL